MEWYVSPSGNDSDEGSKELPFRSLERARDQVRHARSEEAGPITIWLREGMHELRAPLALGPQDVGDVTYASCPGERAVIAGGVQVKGWSRVNDLQGRALWEAPAPEGVDYSRHLFVNGKPAPRPRTKEVEAFAWNVAQDESMSFWNRMETVATYQGELPVYRGYRTNRLDMLDWRNPTDIEAVYDVAWTHSICPIERVERDGEDVLLHMKMPSFRDCQIKAGVQIGTPSYFENVYECLNEPGQWYFDRSRRILTYYAREGERVDEFDFVVPFTDRLLEVQGSLEQPACGLTIQQVEFAYATFMLPLAEGYPEVQSNLLKDANDDINSHSAYRKPAAAVLLHSARSVTLSGCRFSRLGGGAIDIERGSRDIRITGCVFEDIGGNGVQAGGFSASDAHPEDDREIVSGIRIDNSVFQRIGIDFKGSVAVIAGYVRDMAVEHNEIRHIAYSGISMGWGWGYWDPGVERLINPAPSHYPVYDKPTILGNNRIAYNHIHHVLQKLHDGGGIYTLSKQPGSTIIGNYIHHNGNKAGVVCTEGVLRHTAGQYEKYDHYAQVQGFPGGIYMDEASGGFEVRGNIIHDVVAPIHYHEVVKHYFETNAIEDNVLNIGPEHASFPASQAAQAGLTAPWRHLLEEEGSEF